MRSWRKRRRPGSPRRGESVLAAHHDRDWPSNLCGGWMEAKRTGSQARCRSEERHLQGARETSRARSG
eukprot:5553124-Pyramimonas_sp.AAC.1